MGKKIAFPFVNGSLQGYIWNNLSDKETEMVYNGEDVTIGNIEWRPNEEVELELYYVGHTRGRSAVTFYWKDANGHGYPMFIKDFEDMMLRIDTIKPAKGIFTYVKRGQNYGIKLVR